jgi:hypothetical protein
MAGTLRAQFIYRDNAMSHPLTAAYAETEQEDRQKNKGLELFEPDKSLGIIAPPAGIGLIATDVIVGIVGKAAESLVDSIIAIAQPETRTLETTVPLDGFYKANEAAIKDGFLIFHNGTDTKGTKASLMAVLKAIISQDGTAFRFEVMKWEYKGFLIQDEGILDEILPHDSAHDIALKIEFLTPGSQGLGTRAAFSEHIFYHVPTGSLGSLFLRGQALPWIAAPAHGNMLNNTTGLVSPLNIKISLLETAEPGLLAKWSQEIFKENKASITKLAQDSARRVIDPAFAASENMKLIDVGKTTYDDYYKAWEELKKHHDGKPVDGDSLEKWKAEFDIKSQILSAKKVLAIGAFDRAGLPWPGDLSRLTL